MLAIPSRSLVLLVGASGSGKSTLARRHFRPTEVLSSDAFRALVADDETDQHASRDAFEALHFVAARRLAAGRLTVVDATNVRPAARRGLIALARRHRARPIAIVLDLPLAVCEARNRARPDRQVDDWVVVEQHRALQGSLASLGLEGFEEIHHLHAPEEVDALEIRRR